MPDKIEESSEFKEALRKREQEVREELTRRFSEELFSKLQSMRGELEEGLRQEFQLEGAETSDVLSRLSDLLNTSQISEDAQALLQRKDEELYELRVELAEKEERIEELEADLSDLTEVAKEAGYRYYLERELANDPDRDLIERVVGDVKNYESISQIDERVGSIREELERRRARREKRESRRREAMDRALEEHRSLREDNAKLRNALERSLQAVRELGVNLQVEKRISAHPRRDRIRSMVESARPQSMDEVDALIEACRDAPRSREELEAVRQRVRRLTGGGFSGTPLDEEAPSPQSTYTQGGFNGLPVGLDELKELM